MDLPRLLFAIVLGVSVTATILWSVALLAGARAASGRADEGGGALAILSTLGLLSGLVEVTTLASGRFFDPRAPAVALVVGVLVVALAKPLRSAVRHAPLGLLAVIGALRLVGVTHFAAYAEGWLPQTYALFAAVSDVLVGLAAIPLALRLGRREARDEMFARLWAALGFVTLVASVALGLVYVRPMPGFGALRVMFLDVLFAGAHLALFASLRRPRE